MTKRGLHVYPALFAAIVLSFVLNAHAADPPFTEHFATDAANWADAAGTFNLDYVPAGGPDGNGYVSDELNFELLVDADTPTIFRAHQVFGSSGGAFAGNWISDGVGSFSANVRHDLPVPVNFFTRFASPINFPGAIAIEFVPVFPNTWTEVTFTIDENNPQFVSFEGTDFATVFNNVGNVQVGIEVPTGFGGSMIDYRFDVDVASIQPVPEPATSVWVGGLVWAFVGVLRRRR